MKKAASIMLLLTALMFSLMVVAGCGDKVTVDTGDGQATVEVEKGGGKITANQGDENVTLEQPSTAPTEAQLGAPIYPGAAYDAENSGGATSSSGSATAAAVSASFTTPDSFAKVVEWYTGKLGAPTSTSAEMVEWFLGDISTGDYTVVDVKTEGGKVTISIFNMNYQP